MILRVTGHVHISLCDVMMLAVCGSRVTVAETHLLDVVQRLDGKLADNVLSGNITTVLFSVTLFVLLQHDCTLRYEQLNIYTELISQ